MIHATVFEIMNHDSRSLYYEEHVATTSDHATLFRIMNYDSWSLFYKEHSNNK